MTLSRMLRPFAIAALAVASITFTACGGGSHTRGMFNGYVIGKTEAEIVGKYGQPATVDRANPESPIITYASKTFDPDNANRTDPETVIYLGKGKDGRVVAVDVSFRG